MFSVCLCVSRLGKRKSSDWMGTELGSMCVEVLCSWSLFPNLGTMWRGRFQKLYWQAGLPAGSVCPGVGGGCGLPAFWASPAFSHQGSRGLCSRASRFQEKTPSLPPYVNTLGEQTNPHCSEISRGGRPAPRSLAE